MSLGHGGVVAAMVVLVAASVACGEHHGDGGASGEGLSSAGSRSAGRSSSTGGSGGTLGSGTGGSAAGASGHGGSINPPECPAQTPPDWGECPTFGLSCRYERALCDCGEAEEGLVYDCQTLRPPPMCPEVEPISGSACTIDGGCMYGTRGCRCLEDSQTWACWDPAECPSSLPASDSACSPVGMACGYRDGACECAASGWTCSIASDIDAGI